MTKSLSYFHLNHMIFTKPKFSNIWPMIFGRYSDRGISKFAETYIIILHIVLPKLTSIKFGKLKLVSKLAN